MDRKRKTLNFIRDQRLDLVEELKETELGMLENIQITTTLPAAPDLSSLLNNYRLLLVDVLNLMATLDGIEELLLSSLRNQ